MKEKEKEKLVIKELQRRIDSGEEDDTVIGFRCGGLEYFGGIGYLNVGGFIYPEKEFHENMELGRKVLNKWMKKYREDIIGYFQFRKEHYNIDIYEIKIGE